MFLHESKCCDLKLYCAVIRNHSCKEPENISLNWLSVCANVFLICMAVLVYPENMQQLDKLFLTTLYPVRKVVYMRSLHSHDVHWPFLTIGSVGCGHWTTWWCKTKITMYCFWHGCYRQFCKVHKYQSQMFKGVCFVSFIFDRYI